MSRELNYGSTSDNLSALPDAGLAHLSDEVLITRLLEGNSDALTVLFVRYCRMVLSIALRILRDFGEAEDLMQSVFLGVFRTAKEFDSARGTVKIWILQSAYNQAFNRRRYLNLRGIYSDWNDSRSNETTADCDNHARGNAELAQAVKEALGELRKSQRQVVEYAFYEGLTMREIAEKTRKTFHSVRHDYYRALAKLRCILLDTTGTEIQNERFSVISHFRASTLHHHVSRFGDCDRAYRNAPTRMYNVSSQ